MVALKGTEELGNAPRVGFNDVFGVAPKSKFLPKGRDIALHTAQLLLFFLGKIKHKSFVFKPLNVFLKKSNRDLRNTHTSIFTQCVNLGVIGYVKQTTLQTMTEVEKYILQFEPNVQEKLNTLRQLFFEVLPDTEESIRYKMPAFKVGKHHLYFAAYRKHIGLYPVYGLTEIEDKISEFRAKNTKDTLHFMLDRPLPIDLIKNIIKIKSLL